MFGQINEKERARIRIVTRFYLACGENLEATKAFDKTVCKALDIEPEAEPPTFLTGQSRSASLISEIEGPP
jgi:hypothetical protein